MPGYLTLDCLALTDVHIVLGQPEYAISRLSFASLSKRIFARSHSYENVFHLQIHFHANQTNFHIKGRFLHEDFF